MYTSMFRKAMLGDTATLNLDFTTGVLDSRLTFTRASTATFVNSSGYVEYAGANLAVFSELLSTGYTDNAILSRSTTTSPTGNTAVVFYPTLVSDYHRLQFTYAVAVGGATTLSVYVKQIGSNYRVGINSNGYIGASAIFSLVGAGSVVTVGGTAANKAATITKVTDDGWYRIALTGTYAALISTYLFMDSSTSTDSTGGPFTGVASQGVSFWGFQINPGSTAQTYYPTTTAAYHAPRFDYSPTNIGEPRGLLIEGQAINILKNSAYADTNWIAFGGYTKSITTGITSPANDTTAARVTFTAVGHGLYTNNTQMGYSNSVGATYTMSAWIRATANTTNLNIRFGDSAVATGPNIPITTTWTRYSHSYVAVSNSGPVVQSASGTATGEFEMWGFQLELGSGASSYIPTGGSQLTRLADDAVIRSTAWTSLYAQPGAMVVEFYRGAYGTGDRSIMSTDPTAAKHWDLTNANASATAQIAFSSGAPVTQNGLTTGLNKVAIAWNAPTPTASFDLCVNGATPTFGGSNVGTTLSTWLTLGSKSTTGVSGSGTWENYINNSIKSVRYYSALTYAEMQAKTT